MSIHGNYKQAVLRAKDSSTVVTAAVPSGAPVRILKNKMSTEYLRCLESEARI